MNSRFNKIHLKNMVNKGFLFCFLNKQTGLSLPATGLSSLPPSGIKPRLMLEIQRMPRFPISRTCANTMEILLSMTYEEFQKDMNFGIQNSPGFGLYSFCIVLLLGWPLVSDIQQLLPLFSVMLQISHILQSDIKLHTGLPSHWLHLTTLSL